MPIRCAMYHWNGQPPEELADVIRGASNTSSSSVHECKDARHMCQVLVRCAEHVCPGYTAPDPTVFHTSGTWTAAVKLPVGVAVMIGRYV